MKRSTMRTLALGLGVILAGALGTTCVTEPAPLDKTQDESVHKSVFTGEWYYKVTVVDNEFNNNLTFIGEQSWNLAGGGAKLRWEITQDYLNGYLQPQKYHDQNGDLVDNMVGPESLVLSFRIEKHFDIKYLQNNTTREDLNVIVENATDRPWNEREYIIVDWSKNLATDWWQPLGLDTETGYVIREPVATWKNVEFFDVNDQKVNTKRWRPGKDPDIYVLNIDIQEQVHQQLLRWWHIFYYNITGPSKMKTRISLMKKDPEGRPKSQFQARQYRDEYFRRFGYFRTEYEVYDTERGTLESQKQYLANIWDVGCYDDEDTGEQYCKKIIYYMSPTMPTKEEDPDLYDWTLELVNSWNAALQDATGRTDQVFELRENEPLLDEEGEPVYDADGNMRYKYEFGDIRYSFMNYVAKPQSYSPFGYGPSTPDPDTGQIINGSANIYGAVLDRIVVRAMDYYDLMAGNCSYEDVMAGYYWNEETGNCDGGNPGIVAKNGPNHQFRTNFITPALATSYWSKGRINRPSQRIDRDFHEAMRPVAKEVHMIRQEEKKSLDVGKFSYAAGSGYERMMVPNASFGSTFPGARTTDEVLGGWAMGNRLSETGLFGIKTMLDKRHGGRHCILEEDHYDSTILAFVNEMKDEPREDVKRELRHWLYYTTLLHEVGHTLGLRHNFRASVDKANFSDEFHVAHNDYWQEVQSLRDEYQTAIEAGDASAYNAYVTKVNNIANPQYRYGTSSIMDYGGIFDQWHPGLPSYDRAAIMFAYGNKIEVREDQEWVVRDYEEGDFVKDDLYDYSATSESGRVVRYYMNCSDERRWDDYFCQIWDRGTTATEIMRNWIRDQNWRYFFINFKRDRTSFGNFYSYYIRKWFYDYMMYAKAFAQISVHNIWYEEFWDSLWDGLDLINEGPETRDMVPGYTRTGGEDLLRASFLFYYYMMHDVLQRPDYGLYELVYDDRGKRHWESTKPQYTNADSITATVDPGPGWGWQDRWDSQYDQTIYYDKLIRMGVEIDKIVAYEILSIPCVFNDYLWHEKANGNTYWSDLWNNDGSQLWKVTRGFITEQYNHDQATWCMNEQGNLMAMPVDMLEGAAEAGLMEIDTFSGTTRCLDGYYPLQPGMDDLYAIYPIFFGISGAQHPWYYNHLSDYMDSQVKGGNHRFDIPYVEGTPEYTANVAEFVNSTGTKTYQAVNTRDGLSVSYQLVDKGRRVSNRIRMSQDCDNGVNPSDYEGTVGTFGRDCAEVMLCYTGSNAPDYCDEENWDGSFLYPSLGWRVPNRVEAMLIMMQDMVDLAGHYAWRTPGYLDPP